MTTTLTLDEAIEKFCDRLNDAYWDWMHGTVTNPSADGKRFVKHVAGDGKVYIRISRQEFYEDTKTSESAVCFVRRSDGTIWRPSGWKGPAKNFPRGNVYDLDAKVQAHY